MYIYVNTYTCTHMCMCIPFNSTHTCALDVQFWRSRKTLEGLSVRSIFFNVFQSLIVLLYILDNETNFVIIISVFIGQQCVNVWLSGDIVTPISLKYMYMYFTNGLRTQLDLQYYVCETELRASTISLLIRTRVYYIAPWPVGECYDTLHLFHPPPMA